MDIATILTQLAGAARQGGLPVGAPSSAGAGNPLTELAARFGIDPARIGDALGHMGAQAQAGVQDPGALAQAAAAQTGAPAGGLQDLLGQLMGAVQGMQAGGTAGGAGGFDLSAILGQLMGGMQGGAPSGLGGLAQMLDRDGDGQVMDDIADMAGRFLNRP